MDCDEDTVRLNTMLEQANKVLESHGPLVALDVVYVTIQHYDEFIARFDNLDVEPNPAIIERQAKFTFLFEHIRETHPDEYLIWKLNQ